MKKFKKSQTALILSLLTTFIVMPMQAKALSFANLNKIGTSTYYLNELPQIKTDTKKVNQIIYPLISTPAINKVETSLTIKVDTQGNTPSNWGISIKNIESSTIKSEYALTISSIEKSTSYWNNSSSIYNVTVLIPKNVPENLYDLNLIYTSNGVTVADSQPHSVKVVTQFNSNYKFIHLSDLHVGSPRNIKNPEDNVQAGFWNPDDSQRWLYLKKEINEVNLSNPDFVIITGDLMYGQMNPLEYAYEYEETYRMLKQFNVPIYLVPGNHDYYAQDATLTDGAKFWQNYFGPSYYSFDYGSYAHFVGANSFDWNKLDRSGKSLSVFTWGGQIRDKQMNWIRDDLSNNAETATNDQTKVLFCHHNPSTQDRNIWPNSDPLVKLYWQKYDKQHDTQTPDTLLLGETLSVKYNQLWHGEGANELINLMNTYHINTSLHGHTHIDNIKTIDNHLFVTTTATELSGTPYSGYRIFQKEGSGFTSYIYSGESNSIPIYQDGNTSKGIMSTELQYTNPNDGSANAQAAIIYNRLDKEMTLYIPFYMKAGDYLISSGSVVNKFSNGDVQYLLVKTTVPARSSAKINVAK